MINNTVLVGRITKDPLMTLTQNNIACVQFTLAVDRGYKDPNGNKLTDFIQCVAWRSTAEFMANYIKKGYLLGITGKIQTRNYTSNDGRMVYVTEVICDSVQNLQPKPQVEQPPTLQPTNQPYSGKVSENPHFMDIDDGDLPF